ncbi:CHAT domain-containing protein [Spirillospora sp. NPDC127200]
MNAPGTPRAELLRILYLTASARGDLRVDEEIRRVKAGVRAATHRDLVQIEHLPAATATDLLDGLTRFTPHVVHFSGHAGREALVFDSGGDARGAGRPVKASAFVRALRAVDVPPELVVLNACRTKAQLTELVEAVPLAVGMSDGIKDADGMAFAARFYAALTEGQSVRGAYQVAKVQMELIGLPDADLPVLEHAPGVDPAAVKLVLPAPPGTREAGQGGGTFNTISGGSMQGPVIMGRDIKFSGPNYGHRSDPPADGTS